MSASAELVRDLRRAAHTASLYGTTAARVLARARPWTHARGEPHGGRHVFVVGCPRSGTTFFAGALGAQPGMVDLGEVKPLKAALPTIARLPEPEAADRLRQMLELVRRLGLAGRLRGVEQTPETTFVLAAALRAYPQARAVHMLRDGRDVVCSLLERGWLRDTRAGRDDAGLPFGGYARFWVEPERRDEFEHASETRRAAWAWRRYVTAVRSVQERTLEVRFEDLTTRPREVAERVATHLSLDPEPLAHSLGEAHDRSVGRWRRDLSPEQLAEVEQEAGSLLRNLGYA